MPFKAAPAEHWVIYKSHRYTELLEFFNQIFTLVVLLQFSDQSPSI